MENTIRNKLHRVLDGGQFHLYLPVNEWDDAEDLKSYGIRSLDLISLIGLIENEFDIKVSGNEMTFENFQSLGAIIRYLKNRISE